MLLKIAEKQINCFGIELKEPEMTFPATTNAFTISLHYGFYNRV